MEIEKLTIKTRRDFNNTMCLMGIIPFLVFVYLLIAEKKGSFGVFVGQTGYIISITLVVFILGITTGRNMLWSLIKKMAEADRLAAITETVLTLSHEINNPLMVIRGNLELLEKDFSNNNNVAIEERDRLLKVKNNFERIMHVTDKLANLSKPVLDIAYGDTEMVDLNKSK